MKNFRAVWFPRMACACLIVSGLFASSSLQAQDDSAKAKEMCQSLGEAGLLYMRPSADIDDRSYRMTGHSVEQRKDFIIVKSEFRWYGALSGAPYDSSIKVYIEEKDSKPYVTDIIYRDDCPTPIVNDEDILIFKLNRQFGHR